MTRVDCTQSVCDGLVAVWRDGVSSSGHLTRGGVIQVLEVSIDVTDSAQHGSPA